MNKSDNKFYKAFLLGLVVYAAGFWVVVINLWHASIHAFITLAVMVFLIIFMSDIVPALVPSALIS